MKIGLVCAYAFLEPEKGVERRLYQTASLLEEAGQVIPVLVTPDLEPGRLEALRQRYGSATWLNPTRTSGRSLAAKARRLGDLQWIEGRNRHVPPKEALPAITLLKACDVVWFHSLRAADALGVYRWPQGILDLDDLHSDKHRQIARLATTLKARLEAHWNAVLWRRWERDALRRFHHVVVCSEGDRSKLQDHPRVTVMPNIALGMAGAAPDREPSPDRIGFLGTLEYYANHDAVEWLIKEILPLLVAARPSLRLRIAGRIPTGLALPPHPNVDLLDYVHDLGAEMATWSGMVAPIRIGSGTRLKIIDAFSRGCPVVSTTLGCHGLGGIHDRELWIADSTQEMAAACLELCARPESGRRLAAFAYELWQSRYTLESIRPVVTRLVADAAGRSKPVGAIQDRPAHFH